MVFSFRTYLLRVAYILAVISLFSCAKDVEEENIGLVAPKAQVRLELPVDDEATRATETGSSEENLLKNLYLFIFDSSGNKELGVHLDLPYGGSSSDVDMSLWNTERVITILNSAILSDLDMPRNIHVVANVAQSKLAAITNEAQLKEALTDPISGEIAAPGNASPLLMHSICANHVYSSGARATVSLVRNVSKVRLTLKTTDKQGGTNQMMFALENKVFVTAVDVADRAYIVSGKNANPVGVQYIRYASKTLNNPSVSGGEKTFTMPAMYINENVGDFPVLTQTPTYLIIQIPFDAGAGIINDNYYKVQINEGNDLKVKRNTIYDITLNINELGGETEQDAPEIGGTLNVLPWNEKTLISGSTQTYISVEKTTLQLAGGVFNFQCSTNAEMAKRSVTANVSWLTAAFDSDNNIKITANGTGYTVPRTATLSIKANDLTKVITVRQDAVVATDGSIALNPKTIYLSTAHPSRPVALTVTNAASWGNMVSNNSIATYTPASGTGNATLTFYRGGTPGNANFRFINRNTLSYADVQVCNLSLTSSVTELQIPGTGITNETETGIVALGGNASWVVKSKPAWMTVANSGGNLLYSAQAESTENDRNGTIVLSHSNDPDLTVSIQVKQSANYIMFPEFMYLVVRYRVGTHPSGSSWDMDSQTFFQGTGISALDHKGVGYGAIASGLTSVVNYLSNPVMTFGGDNQQSGYETTYVNMKKLLELSYNQLPRYMRIELYDRWWRKNYAGKVMLNLDMVLYNSGEMQSYNTYDFKNTLGTSAEVLNETYTVELKTENTAGPVAPSYTTSQHIATIEYDKFKNRATLTMHRAPGTRSLNEVNNVVQLPGESKDAYSARINNAKNNKDSKGYE